MVKPILVAHTAILTILEGNPSPLPPELMLRHARYALQHTFTVNGIGPAMHHAQQYTTCFEGNTATVHANQCEETYLCVVELCQCPCSAMRYVF